MLPSLITARVCGTVTDLPDGCNRIVPGVATSCCTPNPVIADVIASIGDATPLSGHAPPIRLVRAPPVEALAARRHQCVVAALQPRLHGGRRAGAAVCRNACTT